MIILDTNIVSEVWRPKPDPAVLDWLGSQPTAELRYGAERLAVGLRKTTLTAAIDDLESEGYRDRVLPLDIAAAAEFARLMVKRERAGCRMDTMDALIGAIAIVHGAALATRDMRGFTDLGVYLVNPFDASTGR